MRTHKLLHAHTSAHELTNANTTTRWNTQTHSHTRGEKRIPAEQKGWCAVLAQGFPALKRALRQACMHAGKWW